MKLRLSSLILPVLLLLTQGTFAQSNYGGLSGQRNSPPLRLRYGRFSVLWPVQPRLISQPNVSGGEAAIYAGTLASVTFTFSFLRFASPQMIVSPADFARNMAGNAPQSQILGIWRDQLGGFAADKTLYRIGAVMHLAWSVQPTRLVNYVFNIAGPDSPEFRGRAEQFARSFRLEPGR